MLTSRTRVPGPEAPSPSPSSPPQPLVKAELRLRGPAGGSPVFSLITGAGSSDRNPELRDHPAFVSKTREPGGTQPTHRKGTSMEHTESTQEHTDSTQRAHGQHMGAHVQCTESTREHTGAHSTQRAHGQHTGAHEQHTESTREHTDRVQGRRQSGSSTYLACLSSLQAKGRSNRKRKQNMVRQLEKQPERPNAGGGPSS